MYSINDNNPNNSPIKVWLKDRASLDQKCLQQATHLSTLPFLHKWVALMPDAHPGLGMPIGGVIATKNVIIPNAVGRDIGCGVIFVATNIDAALLRVKDSDKQLLIKVLLRDILNKIPTGFNKYKTKHKSQVIDLAFEAIDKYKRQSDLLKELDNAYFQIGTLGGGNHFIELQEDEAHKVAIMIHSGSRHLGSRVCDHFNKVAQALNRKWYSQVPLTNQLAFLPTDTSEGQDYIAWMNLCMDYAFENRAVMMEQVTSIVYDVLHHYTEKAIAFDPAINCHHNYAAFEKHYKKDVWVHRKGAISAKDGEIGIIPGAMGSYSYLVIGSGNQASFNSSSHGAGRRYSRSESMKKFKLEDVLQDLRSSNISLGKLKKKDLPEESKYSYKDIEEVLKNQSDLTTPIKKLKTIGVVKG